MIIVMHILVKGTITITGAGNGDVAKRTSKRNNGVILKLCTIPWLHKQNKLHPQEDNAKDLDVVKMMYNLK